MITTGIFPDSLKKSKTIPLFKKGEASLLVNYRPISLLPTISKSFERILKCMIISMITICLQGNSMDFVSFTPQ